MNERVTREERGELKRFFPGTRDTLLLSALEGYTGKAFENSAKTAALVVSRGFVFLGGKAQERFFREAAACFPDCFLTFHGSRAWLQIARAWGAGVAMTRFAMETPEKFDEALLSRLAVPPAGYEVRVGDAEAYGQCLAAAWSEDLASCYGDAQAFAADALMIGAFRDGALAAGCGVYARTADSVEIEIDTRPDCRRQGLAACCAAAFLLQCVRRGLRPHWDAMTPISRDLALKLGFVRPLPYPVVCREEKTGPARSL